MGTSLHKATGDILTADDWNALLREALLKTPPTASRRVRVKNSSGADVPKGGILGINGPLSGYAPSDSEVVFTNPVEVMLDGIEPTVADHTSKWVAPLDAVDDGMTMECIAAGVALVKVYVNGVDNGFCDVIDVETVDGEDCYLGTGSTGAQILWRENAGSGADTIVWAIVRIGEAGGIIQWGKVQAGFVNADGTAQRTVSVKSCDVDGTAVGDQTAFDVKTPLKSNAFTDLVENDVVGYLVDTDGEKVIVTDCWATAEGTNWIGVADNHRVYHTDPTLAAEAHTGVYWEMAAGTCGIVLDDAGHVIGYYIWHVNHWDWYSPWSVPDPGIHVNP